MRVQVVAHAYDIPRRLREIDPELTVWYNFATKMYEVVGVDAAGRHYQLGAWPYLDARVERAVRKGYWLARNTGDPYKEVIRQQDEEEYRDELQFRKELQEARYGVVDCMRWSGGQWRGWGAG
ncbi:MAG: hypothetical protein ACUVRO_13395 [Armatimonadota bacterium]